MVRPVPFTLAHPAAVLPLVRRPFDGLALVCGAMAPDAAYFLRATGLEVTAQSWYEPLTNATTTHSLAGLVPTTLLLASALYLMLRAAARPVGWLAHDRWAAPTVRAAGAPPDRMAPRLSWPSRWAWVTVSLLIGTLTHLLWDSLTSSDGFLATRFDALSEPAVADMTWTDLGQHASTAVGLSLLAVVLWRRRRSLLSDETATRRRALWVIAGLVAVGLGAGVASALAELDPSASLSSRDQLENVVSIAVKSAGAAVGMTVLMATACWWLVLARRPGAVQRPPG